MASEWGRFHDRLLELADDATLNRQLILELAKFIRSNPTMDERAILQLVRATRDEAFIAWSIEEFGLDELFEN